MGADINTIFWKELKSIFNQKYSTEILLTIISFVLLSLLLPILVGDHFFEEQLVVFLTTLIAFLFSSIITPLVFTDARDRSLLETLIANRIRVGSIFWGKTAAIVLLTVGLSMFFELFSLLIYNFSTWSGSFHTFTLQSWLFSILLSTLVAVFASVSSVLLSRNLETPIQITLGLILICITPIGLLTVLIFFLPNELHLSLMNIEANSYLLFIGGCLLVIDLILIIIMMRSSFKKLAVNQ